MSLPTKALSLALMMVLAAQAKAADNPVVAHALALVKANAALMHASSDDTFVSRGVIVDRNGDQHVRFDRSYRGLRVIGGDMVVHTTAKGFGGEHDASATDQAAVDPAAVQGG